MPHGVILGTLTLECPHPVTGKRFFNGVLCCADCWGNEPKPPGHAVAGTPRRIQHGVERPEMVKESAPVDTAAVRVRAWLARETTRLPGLTDAERAVVERLADDLEAGG